MTTGPPLSDRDGRAGGLGDVGSGRSAPLPPERWIDARELAALMGVSVSTVKRWRQQGMPSETWGMGRTRRYQASAAMRWAREREAPEGEERP
jgi:hypothetical protein